MTRTPGRPHWGLGSNGRRNTPAQGVRWTSRSAGTGIRRGPGGLAPSGRNTSGSCSRDTAAMKRPGSWESTCGPAVSGATAGSQAALRDPDNHDQRTTSRGRGPGRAWPLGGRLDHRQGQRLRDRHPRRAPRPGNQVAAAAITACTRAAVRPEGSKRARHRRIGRWGMARPGFLGPAGAAAVRTGKPQSPGSTDVPWISGAADAVLAPRKATRAAASRSKWPPAGTRKALARVP